MRAVPTEDWAGMNAQVRGHRKTITDPAAMVSLWAVELTMRRIKTGITARLFMFFRKRSLLPDLLEKLKELLKTSTGTDTTPWIHFLRGDTLRALKRPTEAEAEYRAAISIDPNVPTFHEHLVYILQEQKRPVEAAAEFRVASNLRLREKDAPLR
jgi:tetratricopeptide (TPR) repeat protein